MQFYKRLLSLSLVFILAFSLMPSVSLAATPAPKLAANAAYNSIKLSWKAVSGAASYEIHRKAPGEKAYKRIATLKTTSYTNKKLAFNKTYQYKARAKLSSGKYTSFSKALSVKALPAQPQGLKAVQAGETGQKVIWGAVAGAKGYQLSYAANSSMKGAKTVALSKTAYTCKGLDKTKTYYFRVRAWGLDGSTKVYGPWCKAVSASLTPSPTPTPAPAPTPTATPTPSSTPPPVSGITLNANVMALTIGGSFSLVATVNPAGATNKAVTWNTSDASKVTVDASGKITGIAPSTVTITATTAEGGKQASCVVTVLPAYYGITAQGEFTVGENKSAISGAVVIPAVVNGIAVSSIADRAFEKSNITSVTISNGVTKIGTSAFRECSNLANVNIPNSVTTMGSNVFSRCTNLKTIELPKNPLFTEIPEMTFYQSGLTSIIIPDSVTTIVQYAFSSCASLATVTLPNNSSFTEIPYYGFHQSGLTSITIPDSVTTIGTYAFDSCASLKTVTLPQNDAFTKISYYTFSKSGLTSIIIPDSVTTIEQHAFESCASLADATLPQNPSFTTIPNYAFYKSGLTSITIPDNVTTIGTEAFFNCPKLANVTLSKNPAFTTIPEHTFYGCDLRSLTVPSNVTTFENAAFGANLYLSSVVFTGRRPALLTTAFDSCLSLPDFRYTEEALLADPGWKVEDGYYMLAGRPCKKVGEP